VILAAAAAIARADLLRVKQDDAPARWIQLPHLLRQRMILLRSGINSLHRRLTSGSQARRPMFPDLGQWREWERASENIRESSEVSFSLALLNESECLACDFGQASACAVGRLDLNCLDPTRFHPDAALEAPRYGHAGS
jgi:hypothetical protein